MKGAIAKADELVASIPNSFIPGQFVNPANPKIHRETTGPEIWNDTDVYDEIFRATNDDAFATARLLAKKEGISVGISSGAALFAAIELAKKSENKGKTIVALLPDSGDRYYSTPLFTD